MPAAAHLGNSLCFFLKVFRKSSSAFSFAALAVSSSRPACAASISFIFVRAHSVKVLLSPASSPFCDRRKPHSCLQTEAASVSALIRCRQLASSTTSFTLPTFMVPPAPDVGPPIALASPRPTRPPIRNLRARSRAAPTIAAHELAKHEEAGRSPLPDDDDDAHHTHNGRRPLG